MSTNHKVETDCVVQPCHYSPHKILYYSIIILACAVIGMEAHSCLTKAMVTEVIVEQADYSVSAFSSVDSLVNNYVIYLTWKSLTTNSKYGCLSWSQKIYWPRLHGITRVMNLLRKIEGVMSHNVLACWWYHSMGWWWLKHSSLCKVIMYLPLAFLQLVLVQ